MPALLAIGALAVGAGARSSAQADVLRNFPLANWFAGPYSFDGSEGSVWRIQDEGRA
jgi:hypothetical protein